MRRGAALRGAAAFLAAGLATLPRAGAATAQTTRPEVVELRFQGNDAFPDDSLARAIVTRATECRSAVFQPLCWFGADFAVDRAYLPRREFPLDQIRLRVYYQQRGYREAAVDTTTTSLADGKLAVTFRIDEGRPVRIASMEFTGTEEVAVPELLDDLPVEVGDPLSTIALDAARDTLMLRLANAGYAHAEVLRSYRIENDRAYDAMVTMDVAPGPRSVYGHVSVSGNEHLTESTVLRTLQFRSGDLFSRAQLHGAQGRLFGLEIIRSASVTPDLGADPDSVIPVAVEIQESDPRRVRAGAGWTSSECMDVDARWVHRNFLGGGRRIQVRGRVSNILARDFQDLLCPQSGEGVFSRLNWIASVDFAQPWIFSTRNAFQASVYGERQSLPDVFVRKALGLTLSLTRNIGPRTPLTLSYRPELSELDAAEILLCTSFQVCTKEDIASLQGANWLAPVGLTFSRNVTNNVLNPSRGYSLLLDLEHADAFTGSNFTYTRIQADGARYERLPNGFVLAGRLRGGWVAAGSFDELLDPGSSSEIVHPQKRFYAGGANSVRGYPQSRLGPRVLTIDVARLVGAGEDGAAVCGVADGGLDPSCDASELPDEAFLARPTGGSVVLEGSLEARFPLSSSFQGAVFTDFGQVWDTADRVTSGTLRVTPGFGVRFLSPIGPLRLDLAYRPYGGELLSVLTQGIEPSSQGAEGSFASPDGRYWVASEDLVALGPRVLYGESPATSLRRWQLHLSIGQAF